VKVRVYRNHDATEWTTVHGDLEDDEQELDVFGKPMILQHSFETTDEYYSDVASEVETRVAKVASTAYQLGYLDGLADIANADCAVHSGMRHGGEAEELRMGIEEIIKGPLYEDYSPQKAAEEVLEKLRTLLDSVDARDSLAHAEMKK
jgi:hypothetical protein